MKSGSRFARVLLASVLAFSVAGCASARDRRTDNTLIGAGLGAAAGAVVSQGDPLYTIGGAAAGGLLGNILTSEPRHEKRGYRGSHYRHVPPGHAKKHYRQVHKKHHHKHHRHRR